MNFGPGKLTVEALSCALMPSLPAAMRCSQPDASDVEDRHRDSFRKGEVCARYQRSLGWRWFLLTFRRLASKFRSSSRFRSLC